MLKHYVTTGNVAAGRSTGRPRLTTDRSDRILIQIINVNRIASAASCAKSWSDHLDQLISRRTVHGRITDSVIFVRLST